LCIEEFSIAWQVKDELQNTCYKNNLINGKLILPLSYTLAVEPYTVKVIIEKYLLMMKTVSSNQNR
jgi:hypothetical protein